MLIKKIVIFLPLMLVMFLDLTFTLMGQPNVYWDDYNACHEGSPIGQFFLKMGPEFFLGSFAVYVFAAYTLVSKLQKPFDSMVTLVLFLGHSWGSASWLQHMFSSALGVQLNSWWLHVFYFALVSSICGVCSWNIKKD